MIFLTYIFFFAVLMLMLLTICERRKIYVMANAFVAWGLIECALAITGNSHGLINGWVLFLTANALLIIHECRHIRRRLRAETKAWIISAACSLVVMNWTLVESNMQYEFKAIGSCIYFVIAAFIPTTVCVINLRLRRLSGNQGYSILRLRVAGDDKFNR